MHKKPILVACFIVSLFVNIFLLQCLNGHEVLTINLEHLIRYQTEKLIHSRKELNDAQYKTIINEIKNLIKIEAKDKLVISKGAIIQVGHEKRRDITNEIITKLGK